MTYGNSDPFFSLRNLQNPPRLNHPGLWQHWPPCGCYVGWLGQAEFRGRGGCILAHGAHLLPHAADQRDGGGAGDGWAGTRSGWENFIAGQVSPGIILLLYLLLFTIIYCSILIYYMLYIYINWLVVPNILYFPFHIWDVILPTDELIFFKMLIACYYTTSDGPQQMTDVWYSVTIILL